MIIAWSKKSGITNRPAFLYQEILLFVDCIYSTVTNANAIYMTKLIEKNQDFWNLISSVIFISLIILLIYYLKVSGKMIYKISSFDFFILTLAVFRLIRLFTYDDVTEYIRSYLAKSEKGPKKTLYNLLDCPWCTGVWMSFIVIFLYTVVPYSWVLLLIMALAGAGTFIQITIWKIGLENNK